MKTVLCIHTFALRNEMPLWSFQKLPFREDEMLTLWVCQTQSPTSSSFVSLTCPSPCLSPWYRHCLLFVPPLSFLSQMEATQCQKLPSTAACLRRQVTTKVKRVVVGCLSAREIKFALPWPKLVSELRTAVSGVSHGILFQTLPLGGRGGCKTVSWSEYIGEEHGEEWRNRRQRKKV